MVWSIKQTKFKAIKTQRCSTQDTFNFFFFGTSKIPELEQLEIDITKNLKRRNSMFVGPMAPVVNFNYRLYVDKMFDQKQQTIISYFNTVLLTLAVRSTI